MSDLIEFLKARLGEDEHLARAVEDDSEPWPGQWAYDDYGLKTRNGWTLAYPHDDQRFRPGFGTHVARHDPARVLREVEAKRRIIAEHALMFRDIGWLDEAREEVSEELEVCGRCVPKHSNFTTRADVPTGPCLTVRLLATAYVTHEDYRSEWAP